LCPQQRTAIVTTTDLQGHKILCGHNTAAAVVVTALELHVSTMDLCGGLNHVREDRI
jgi:hypothetical protein